ncbi:5342_t:CDS:2 [Ambispora gerdemannii]|uniref:5342_t:CDS:1 n=1 Tax=Ambispora gerdemannii TaxID=144530 RepID=A0A9N9DQR9_9GLOM|nr:5342_t:CDS:2 [Ambispora gerdemannii]
MSDTQSKIDSLQELNSQLIATVADLRKENAEIKAENTKLKQTLPEKQNNLTHDRVYFRNKIVWGYSDLYKEFSSEKFDYYGIHEGSLCSMCKQSHEEGKSIKGRYEAGSYFIKCKQQEIEITAKILTDDYCKWHANLVDLPSSQTDKIRSRLYKAYMEETGLDPWIKSETFESPQSENADNHIIQDISLETQVMAPNKNRLYQYAIEHGINSKEFSIITEAEKNRWAMGCFRGDLERDIHFYRDGIERKEDPRKYRKFLTDRDRLIGEELLRRSILKSDLSTTWLDDLMKEWEEIHIQFVQIFSQT